MQIGATEKYEVRTLLSKDIIRYLVKFCGPGKGLQRQLKVV